jgi:hypothetical protein
MGGSARPEGSAARACGIRVEPVPMRSLLTPAAVVGFLIFLAICGTWNEIRFQGCVGRQDQMRLANVTADPQQPALVTLECHRAPLFH